jgi:esterase/lipase
MSATTIFGIVSGGLMLGGMIGLWIWRLSAKLKELEKDAAKEPVKESTAKLSQEVTETREIATKNYDLLREHMTKIAATGERQIELLRELISIVKDLQGDVTEMKIRNKVRSGN